jgi:hypothetical protein
MAQLDKKPCPGDWSFSDGWDKRHDEQFRALQEASMKVDTKVSLVGGLIGFPWADGSAFYRVTKDKPLVLQHVPIHDAWQVPYTQIRGLRRDDVVQMIESSQALVKLFSGKGA